MRKFDVKVDGHFIKMVEAHDDLVCDPYARRLFRREIASSLGMSSEYGLRLKEIGKEHDRGFIYVTDMDSGVTYRKKVDSTEKSG